MVHNVDFPFRRKKRNFYFLDVLFNKQCSSFWLIWSKQNKQISKTNCWGRKSAFQMKVSPGQHWLDPFRHQCTGKGMTGLVDKIMLSTIQCLFVTSTKQTKHFFEVVSPHAAATTPSSTVNFFAELCQDTERSKGKFWSAEREEPQHPRNPTRCSGSNNNQGKPHKNNWISSAVDRTTIKENHIKTIG